MKFESFRDPLDLRYALSSIQCRPQIAVPQAVCLFQFFEPTRHFVIFGTLLSANPGFQVLHTCQKMARKANANTGR
ncbi:MAG: hypothetical protein CMN21_14740 [Rubinisphaera sp.]|nr:hypothetical protein [Rubinisphaera sp.]